MMNKILLHVGCDPRIRDLAVGDTRDKGKETPSSVVHVHTLEDGPDYLMKYTKFEMRLTASQLVIKKSLQQKITM